MHRVRVSPIHYLLVGPDWGRPSVRGVRVPNRESRDCDGPERERVASRRSRSPPDSLRPSALRKAVHLSPSLLHLRIATVSDGNTERERFPCVPEAICRCGVRSTSAYIISFPSCYSWGVAVAFLSGKSWLGILGIWSWKQFELSAEVKAVHDRSSNSSLE